MMREIEDGENVSRKRQKDVLLISLTLWKNVFKRLKNPDLFLHKIHSESQQFLGLLFIKEKELKKATEIF